MSNYTKTVDYAAKDLLLHGNAAKIIKGTEIGAEFDAIATMSATKLEKSDAQVVMWCGTNGGTADAITLTPTFAISAYVAGQKFRFNAGANNTGAMTVAISGLGTKAIQASGAVMAVDQVVANKIYEIVYDGTAFQIQGLAAGLTYKPAGTVAATNVQDAIDEIVSDNAASSGSNLIGHISSGAGAAATTVRDKLREIVSVKDFGAVLDGATDDTAAFTAAWAECVASRKWLRADGGIALISSTLTLSDNGDTWWDGSTENRPIGFEFNCVLKYTGTGPCVMVYGGVMAPSGYIQSIIGPGVTVGTAHVTDGAITAASATLTSASTPFDNTTIGNVGDYVEVFGAGPEGRVLCTTIASITSTGSVELTQAAYTTVTNALVRIIPASYPSYGLMISKNATTFTSANGADGVDVEVDNITDFDCNVLVNGWNNKIRVGELLASHTCIELHNSNCNNLTFGNIGGIYLGGGLLAARRARTSVNGIRLYSGAGTTISGGAVQYCGMSDAGCGIYIASSYNTVHCYVEGNVLYGSNLHVTGNTNTLGVAVRGTPLETRTDGVIIEGYGNTLCGVDDLSSASDIVANSPTQNVCGTSISSGNFIEGAFIEKQVETEATLNDDLITTRTAAGWVPTASITEATSYNYPDGYPESITGNPKSVKLEIAAGVTTVQFYTLATAVSTTGETKTRARLRLLARAVVNDVAVVERPNIMVALINGAVTSSQVADNTAGKEIYGQYSTRISSEWELIDFYVDVPTLPATLKVRIAAREQNRSAGTAALEVYFPEPMLTFNTEHSALPVLRSPVYRQLNLVDSGSATINADGARLLKFTGTPTVTTITGITSMKNSEFTVFNDSSSVIIVLNHVIRIGSCATWLATDDGQFLLQGNREATADPSATAPWSTSAWVVGDRCYESIPVVGQPKSWVCTVAGTPGTWVSEGNL